MADLLVLRYLLNEIIAIQTQYSNETDDLQANPRSPAISFFSPGLVPRSGNGPVGKKIVPLAFFGCSIAIAM
jgi:hypothetical protein